MVRCVFALALCLPRAAASATIDDSAGDTLEGSSLKGTAVLAANPVVDEACEADAADPECVDYDAPGPSAVSLARAKRAAAARDAGPRARPAAHGRQSASANTHRAI